MTEIRLHRLTMVSVGESLLPFRIDDFEIKGITNYSLNHLQPGLAELALTLIVRVPTEDERDPAYHISYLDDDK